MGFVRGLSITVLVLGLTACKIEQQLEAVKEYAFSPENITEITYSKGGGLPLPKQVQPYTRLGMSKGANNVVRAVLKTESCNVEGNVSIYDFNAVAGKIHRSGIHLSELRVADAGYQTIEVSAGAIKENYHLRGDGSNGEPVLTDGPEIGLDLEAIVNRMKQQGCKPPKPEPLPVSKYSDIHFSSEALVNGSILVDTHWIPPTPALEFSVDFSQSEARFTGVVRKFAIRSTTKAGESKKVEVCRESFEKVKLGDDLRNEANMISFSNTHAICMIGKIDKYATSPQLTAFSGQTRLGPGGFTCEWGTRVNGHAALFKKINAWLKNNSKCHGGSIL
jgi:hypothetical protein